ncbi:MAG: hypothetical protein IJX67_06655 [Oscillospiraceae bacterium]|nr:hypothetical protein [Oscillospiraceae bacterium]
MTETPYSLDRVAIRMVKEPPLYSSTPIRSPDDAVRLMAEMLKGYDREVFCIVNFRNDMTPINMNIVSMGTLNASLVHPREILKSSILSNAAHVMAFHNHPSGSLSPSQEDIQITDRLQKLLDLAGIPLLDHIIIGNGDRYYSFRENQTLPVSENRFATAPEQIQFSPVPEMMVAESTVLGKTADSNRKIESRADRVKAITDKLETGIAALFQSETYKAYLSTMSKFHNYSLNNTLLIAMQKPDATLVAGYQAWQKQHQRHVKKGEKGIQIIAPSPYKAKKEREVLDPATGRPKLDAQGKPVREIVEVEYPAFRVATVFDVSQTEGKELPSLGVDELTGKVDSYGKLLSALTETCPVPIGFEEIGSGAKGYYHTTEHRIALQEGMSEAQTVKTLIHEMAHQRLHSHEKEKPREERLNARSKEVEAESVAYTVCQHFGIDTSDYSFGYIAGWSSGKETAELKASLGKIRDAASEMITEIEAKLNEMEKAPELAVIPETAPEMTPDKAAKTSGKDARQTVGREDEKASVLKELTAKKAEPKDPGRSRKKPARREQFR